MGNLARSIILVFVFCFLFPCSWEKRFQPTWDSLDTHVAPPWYDEAKFGIFMTWVCIQSLHLVMNGSGVTGKVSKYSICLHSLFCSIFK